jgi:hypothetical protein
MNQYRNNIINEDENIDDLSDDLYRSQFLQAFKLDDWNGAKINNTFEFLQTILENDYK